MAPIDKIEIELTVLVGQAALPLRQLLQKGRGAVIALGGDDQNPLEILANGRKIACGRVVLQGDDIAVEVVETARSAA